MLRHIIHSRVFLSLRYAHRLIQTLCLVVLPFMQPSKVAASRTQAQRQGLRLPALMLQAKDIGAPHTLLQLIQLLALTQQLLSRMHQTALHVICGLHCVLHSVVLRAQHMLRLILQAPEQSMPILDCALRGSGRCRRAYIGDKIGDREIGLVAYAAYNRDFARSDRARDDFFVERPQILNAATTPA